MSLFSMRNLKIRVIYHGEMGKIGKLKLGSAVESLIGFSAGDDWRSHLVQLVDI